jgi:hypothetical protein
MIFLNVLAKLGQALNEGVFCVGGGVSERKERRLNNS